MQALRRERGGEVFDASDPQKALGGCGRGSAAGSSNGKGVELVDEFVEALRVDVPEHVIGEVTRGLINNAVESTQGARRRESLGAS